MIPLRDVIPSRTVPVMTVALIAGSGLVFALERGLGADRLLAAAGSADARLSWAGLVAAAFRITGPLALAGHAIYLWLFGRTVEDRLGHGRFLAFYVLCVAAAAAAGVAAGLDAPAAGGSGALAGVLAAYVVLHPGSKIVTLVPLPPALRLAEVPAVLFLGCWVMAQLAGVARSPAASAADVWGLAAGAAAGACGVLLFRRPERQRVDWWDPVRG